MTYDKSTIVFEPIPTHWQFVNLTDQTFHRLTVLGYAEHRGHNQLWFCECVCGKIARVTASHLTSGHTQSCGCWHVERCIQEFQTHGKVPEYAVYQTARARCNNPNNKSYADYGERGINFRFDSYEEFIACLGCRPTPDHTLERINNEGHYEPGNVKWATRSEQSRNQRKNRWITINGVTKCATDWSLERGYPKGIVNGRMMLGWCEPCAVFQPLRGHCSHKG